MKTALVCIASELETPYIREFVEYHHKLGYDEIFVYMNNSDFSELELPQYVHLIPYNGTVKQLSAYNNFLDNYSRDYDWATFIDVDEFIVLKKHKDVKEFFAEYDYFGIGMNWKLFGSNGLEDVDDNYSVIERFTKSEKGINQHIKTSLNMKKIRESGDTFSLVKFVNPHFVNLSLKYSFIISPNKNNYVVGPFNVLGDDETAYIAHYVTKSKEECRIRRSFIRADTPSPREEGWEAFFNNHNKNDVENKDVLNLWQQR